ncbi:MAG: M18 family aminopeptidase [Ruminococcaceae bacterium]|nr:M18 family aminopeptidase [Oscillospiraceae bacterium]
MKTQYNNKELSQELVEFINTSPSAFHSIKTISEILEKNGYKELFEGEKWELQGGQGYYVTRNNSSVIAFVMPEGEITGFNIAASHSDYPCFKLKDNCELSSSDFVRINTEKYGGMICATWLDRPLSVAGRIVVRTENGIESRLVDVDRDILMIPNVAVHMNRNVNDGFKFNPAVDTVPLYSCKKGETGIIDTVAKWAGVEKEDILGTDLFVYNRNKGIVWGENDEFVSSRGLDDLQCAFANLKGLLGAKPSTAVPVMACFDNEEVGSSTKQGAASTFLFDTLRRIVLTKDAETFRRLLASSFLLSCDNAHAVHPNHPEYSDSLNKVKVNGGVVIKFNASQRYTTDSVSESIVKLLCKRNDIPVQMYANRSDIAGGSTLGGIATTRVSINSADVGLAQYAMHSCYETAGSEDTACLVELSRVFFETPIIAKENNKYTV